MDRQQRVCVPDSKESPMGTKLRRRYVQLSLYHWLQKYVPLLKHISEGFEAFAY